MNKIQLTLLLISLILITLGFYYIHDSIHYDNNVSNNDRYSLYHYLISSVINIDQQKQKEVEYYIKVSILEIDNNDTTTINNNNPLENSIMILPLPKRVLTSSSSSVKRYLISLHTLVKINITIFNDNDINDAKDIINRIMSTSISKHFNNHTNNDIDILSISTVEVIISGTLSNIKYDHHHDEYNISIDESDKITINADDMSGMRAALVSFVQILDSPVAVGLPLYIIDWADSSWRGLLVDVARHYQPLELLKRCVTAMELAKLNTLHLHLTDSQSFPILLDDVYDGDELLELSQLALKGSFSRDKTYSKNDLLGLIEYANHRGITIIPEIDIPAHTLSWNRAFKGIVVNCSATANSQDNSDNVYVLDPSIPLTMKIVKAVVKQISQLFPSKYLHIGGDEVNIPCWEENKNLMKWSIAKNLTLLEIYQSFEADIIQYTKTLNKIPIVWQGIQDANAIQSNDKTTVIQPWKCWSSLGLRASSTALSHGNPIILSACMYLDYDEDWSSYLSSDILPTAKGMLKIDNSSNPFKKIFGGEGSLWGEHVDHTNFECRIWPRAAAIAQLLWGKPDRYRAPKVYGYSINAISEKLPLNESILMYSSLIMFRRYLVSIGISAAPIIFHSYTDATKREMIPSILGDELQSILFVFCIKNMSSSLYSKDLFADCNVRISAQCLGLPQSTQRAIALNKLSFAQVNIGEGGSELRRSDISNWMLEKANLGVIGIGLCELNGWQELESKTVLLKNLQKINFRAAAGGFAYSHIMVNSQPYNIGFASSLPFEVINEYGPPIFQRGLLHVYYKRFKLHIMIVHLHAHSSEIRETEANFIVSLLKPILLDKSMKLIVMGDFNTFSSFDKQQHQYYNISSLFQRTDNEVFSRLRQKYLKNNQIAYGPMDTLLGAGLFDSCVVSCRQKTGELSSSSWSIIDLSPFSMCMQKFCSRTEPTAYDPEWPKFINPRTRPPIRLDFILVSESFITSTKEAREDIYASVDINNMTNTMSDHYPTYVSNSYHEKINFY